MATVGGFSVKFKGKPCKFYLLPEVQVPSRILTFNPNVDIDSDMATRESLESFCEEFSTGNRKEYLTLHAEDCLLPSQTKNSKGPC